MKQEEKSKRSKEYILSCAFAAFASSGYENTSVNAICSTGKISKGMLYHYFADKDALYLACVDRCFSELSAYISSHLDKEHITPERYFDVRMDFFRNNPSHQNLFCNTVANPPLHLADAIRSCRAAFDHLNETLLTAILEQEKLSENITMKDAILQLSLFEDFLSTRLKSGGTQMWTLEHHDKLCRQAFRIMLYGVIARE